MYSDLFVFFFFNHVIIIIVIVAFWHDAILYTKSTSRTLPRGVIPLSLSHYQKMAMFAGGDDSFWQDGPRPGSFYPFTRPPAPHAPTAHAEPITRTMWGRVHMMEKKMQIEQNDLKKRSVSSVATQILTDVFLRSFPLFFFLLDFLGSPFPYHASTLLLSHKGTQL